MTIGQVDRRHLEYSEAVDGSILREDDSPRDATSDEIFKKGTSRRIWQVCISDSNKEPALESTLWIRSLPISRHRYEFFSLCL